METNKKYTERLLKFARRLQTLQKHPEYGLYGIVNLVALEEKIHTSYKVKYHEWVFQELVCFDEWYLMERNGNPMCKGANEEQGTVAAVVDFFYLTLDEFIHLFDLEGLQNIDSFGGRKLNLESTGKDIAYNIIELVKRTEVLGPGFFP